MNNNGSGKMSLLSGLLVFLMLSMLVQFAIAASLAFTPVELPTHKVVAAASTGTYSTQTHFFCEEGERYFECDETGLGEELFFQPGERLVAATGRGPGDTVTFYCDVDGQVSECFPKRLVEVNY